MSVVSCPSSEGGCPHEKNHGNYLWGYFTSLLRGLNFSLHEKYSDRLNYLHIASLDDHLLRDMGLRRETLSQTLRQRKHTAEGHPYDAS